MRLRLAALLVLALAFVRPARAVDIYDCYTGSAEQGGQRLTTNGIQTDQFAQQSFPLATVTVLNHGTVTLSTIFADAAGTIPLANPFTAATTGKAVWCAVDGHYDAQYSGAALGSVAPFTISNIHLSFSGAGAGTVTNFTAGNLAPLFTTSVATSNTTPALSFSLSSAAANLVFGNCTVAPGVPNYCSITTPMLPFTYAGNTTELGTVSGAVVSGDCAKFDAFGNIVDNGSACGGGGAGNPASPSGTLQINNAGSFGSIPIYTPGPLNWTASPAGTVSIGANTITLTTCPAGIVTNLFVGDGSNPWTYIHVGATGTPEDVLVTATTCTQGGGAAGTVTFTAAGNHAAGFTLGSSSGGLQEAINAAMQDNHYGAIPDLAQAKIIVSPAVYTVTAPVSVRGTNETIDWAGADIECNLSDSCIVIGDRLNQNATSNVTIEHIAGRPNVALGNFAFIEDNAQATHFFDVTPLQHKNSNPTASFGNFIQIDDDEAAVIDTLRMPGNVNWSHCGTDFCSTAVAGKSGKPGVVWIKNSNINLVCNANGVDLQGLNNDNRISDSVIQAYPQFGMRATGGFGGNAITLTNVYTEVGACTNPLGIGIAGLIVQSGSATIQGGVGPAGAAQQFANTGATQYNYWLVVRDGANASTAYPIGYALTNGAGSITVKWEQHTTGFGTTVYDLIRTSGPLSVGSFAPYTAICGGGTPTTCGSVATGLTIAGSCAAVGSSNICSFADNAAANTTAYTVITPPSRFPVTDFLAANVYNAAPSPITAGSPMVIRDRFTGTSDNVTLSFANVGATAPSFAAQQCAEDTTATSAAQLGIWVTCLESTMAGVNGPGATLLNSGIANSADAFGLKGRLNFEQGIGSNTIQGTQRITLVDSNPVKTMASARKRPAWDANDTYIGLDNVAGQVSSSLAQLAYGAPVSISNYIGAVPDNTSWLERLTSALKTFKVPITTNSQITSTLASGTAPLVVTSTTPVANLTTVPTTYDHSGTQQTATHVVRDRCTLGTDCSVTLAGAAVFTSSSSYDCVAIDRTAAAAIQFVPSSGSTFALTGTSPDTISYICIGN